MGVRKAIATATESHTHSQTQQQAHARTYIHIANSAHWQNERCRFVSRVCGLTSAHTILDSLERFVDLVYRPYIVVARKHFAGLFYNRNRKRELTRKWNCLSFFPTSV